VKATLEPLSKLVGMPRNPKAHNLGDIHQSYDRFGFVHRIVCNEATGHIVAGHGRVEALRQRKALNLDVPAGVVVKPDDWYVPADWIDIPEREEEALAIALNKIGEGEWKDIETAQILADLAAQDRLEGTGFDGDDVDQLLKLTAPQIAKEDLDDFRKAQEDWQWMRVKVRIATREKFSRIRKATKHAFENDDEIIDFLLSLMTDELVDSL